MTETTRVRVSPPLLKIDPEEGFTDENDLFSYGKFGKNVADLFCNAEGMNVVLLDDDWGMGKTVFAKQWAGLMRQRGHDVIEIDAFANDFQQDPFLMLVSEIKNAFPDTTETLVENAAKVGNLVVNVLLKSASGGIIDGKEIENAFRKRVNNVEEDKKSLNDFQESLVEFAATHVKKNPLIIVIDELDRCRPDFALRLLERIKHFFSIDGISFLLVANMTQLSAMVKNAYGFSSQEEACTYLEKFYIIRMTLPKNVGVDRNRKSFPLFRRLYIQHLSKKMNLIRGASANAIRGNYFLNEEKFIELANANMLSLRSIEKIATHIAIITTLGIANKGYMEDPLITGLLIIRIRKPGLYTEISTLREIISDQTGGALWKKVKDALSLEDVSMETRAFWRSLADPTTPSPRGVEGEKITGSFSEENLAVVNFRDRHAVGSREQQFEVLSFVAGQIDEAIGLDISDSSA